MEAWNLEGFGRGGAKKYERRGAHLIHILHSNEREDRAEDLLLHDRAASIRGEDDRRWDESVLRVALVSASAEDLATRGCDEVLGSLGMGLGRSSERIWWAGSEWERLSQYRGAHAGVVGGLLWVLSIELLDHLHELS